MEREENVVKLAVQILNENNLNLKKNYISKSQYNSIVVASPPTPPAPPDPPAAVLEFYICRISATELSGTLEEKTKTFTTTASQITPEDWKFIFEFNGWTNVRVATLQKDVDQTKLFSFQKDNAITPKTIPRAEGSKASAYLLTFNYEDKDGAKQSKQFVTQATFMSLAKARSFVRSKFAGSGIKDLKIKVEKSINPGSLKFINLKPDILETSSDPELSQEFAWQITAKDSSGNDHVIVTVKSKTPIESYVAKLRAAGFTNIVPLVSNRAGRTKLDDINVRFTSIKKDDIIDKTTKFLERAQDIADQKGISKTFREIKDFAEWWKKI